MIQELMPRGKRLIACISALVALLALAPGPQRATASTVTVTLPTGQQIDPAGALVTLGRGPQDLTVTPDRTSVIVTNAGRSTQELSVVDVRDPLAPVEVQRLVVHPNWVGTHWVGDRLYTSGGQANLVHVLRWDRATRRLVDQGTIALFPTDQFPGAGGFGVDIVRDSTSKGSRVTIGGSAQPTPVQTTVAAAPLPVCLFAAGMAGSPDGTKLYVACQQSGTVAVVNTVTRKLDQILPIGGFPYGVATTPDGKGVFVSDWSQPRLVALRTLTGGLLAPAGEVRVGKHPSTLLMSRTGMLYVTNGNDDTITVVKTNGPSGTISSYLSLRPYVNAPRSSMPTDIALSPDENTLYVTLGGNNALAVIDLRSPPRSPADMRYVPTAWFPTAVATSADGATLYIASGKGLGSGPNSQAGDPGPTQQIMGTLQVVGDVPANLATLTAIVRRDNAFDVDRLAQIPSGTAMYDHALGRSLVIEHVVLVVRENKTFDQVLGDMSDPAAVDLAGNSIFNPDVRGEPRLVRYGVANTPNTHALAEEFVTADNFKAPIEESFTGHQWLNFAQLSDYSSRVWTTDERNVAIGVADLSLPGEGSLLNRARDAGLSYGIYGWDGMTVSGRPENLSDFATKTNQAYPTSLQYYTRDIDRINGLLTDIKTNRLPQFSYAWIPNDHTYDLQAGARKPQSMVADNDWAAGKIVEVLSHSPYWDKTAVFFVEDDPQSGKDHIDSHRTVFLAASPWIKRGHVSHELYDFSSLHRTVEILLGLTPTSQYEDKSAAPLAEIFRNVADGPSSAAYTAIEPAVSPNDLNPPLDGLNEALRPFGALALNVDRTTVDRDEEKVREILDAMYHLGLWQYGAGLAPLPTDDVLAAERRSSSEDD